MPTELFTRVYAPGKVMLTGEYAVLAGAPALVAAADRGVTGRFLAGHEGLFRKIHSRFEPVGVGEARRVFDSLRHLLPSDASIELEATPLFHPEGKGKLGLGSSAAEAVVLFHLLRPEAFSEPLEQRVNTLRDLAEAGASHRGSGSDFVASMAGGVHRVKLGRGRVTFAAAPAPPLAFALVHTGRSMPTRFHLQAFQEGREGVSEAFASALKELTQAAKAAVERWERVPLQVLRAYGESLLAFLEVLAPECVVPEYREVIGLAEACGGVGKPAGAGGGDCILTAFEEDQERVAFLKEASGKGFFAFAWTVDPSGVRVLEEARD